ncbi:hypothetical protein B0T13DRAFT_38928 [Neurospora crassa]|nr:hypothetical protein B0T13DRAFT_38928 [Neurospora crassa]
MYCVIRRQITVDSRSLPMSRTRMKTERSRSMDSLVAGIEISTLFKDIVGDGPDLRVGPGSENRPKHLGISVSGQLFGLIFVLSRVGYSVRIQGLRLRRSMIQLALKRSVRQAHLSCITSATTRCSHLLFPLCQSDSEWREREPDEECFPPATGFQILTLIHLRSDFRRTRGTTHAEASSEPTTKCLDSSSSSDFFYIPPGFLHLDLSYGSPYLPPIIEQSFLACLSFSLYDFET